MSKLKPPDNDDQVEVLLEPEEDRRAYVLEMFSEAGNISELDGKILVQNMDVVYQWLVEGTVPSKEEQPMRFKRLSSLNDGKPRKGAA